MKLAELEVRVNLEKITLQLRSQTGKLQMSGRELSLRSARRDLRPPISEIPALCTPCI